MKLLAVLIQVLLVQTDWPTLERPRRVFTRGFVATCLMVAVIEWMVLSALVKG